MVTKDEKHLRVRRKILTLRDMKNKEQQEAEENERIRKLMPRLRNWFLCYRTSRQRNISSIHLAMLRLIQIYGYPDDYPVSESEGFKEPHDLKDADKLEYVWSTMGAEWEAETFVDEKQYLTIKDAKILIKLLVFEDSKTFYFARRAYFGASERRYDYLIHKSLLFFDMRVKLYEWAQGCSPE
jgi:hypothetical protein